MRILVLYLVSCLYIVYNTRYLMIIIMLLPSNYMFAIIIDLLSWFGSVTVNSNTIDCVVAICTPFSCQQPRVSTSVLEGVYIVN